MALRLRTDDVAHEFVARQQFASLLGRNRQTLKQPRLYKTAATNPRLDLQVLQVKVLRQFWPEAFGTRGREFDLCPQVFRNIRLSLQYLDQRIGRLRAIQLGQQVIGAWLS